MVATGSHIGQLQAPLVSADGETISLPAPVVVDATTLKGDGWTATVGPGWTVRRAHDRDRSASCGNDQTRPDLVVRRGCFLSSCRADFLATGTGYDKGCFPDNVEFVGTAA
jgi:hypothetical protein